MKSRLPHRAYAFEVRRRTSDGNASHPRQKTGVFRRCRATLGLRTSQPHPSSLISRISDVLEKRFPSADLRRDENPLFSAIFEHAEGDPCFQAAKHPPTVDGHRQTPKTAWPPIGLRTPRRRSYTGITPSRIRRSSLRGWPRRPHSPPIRTRGISRRGRSSLPTRR